MTAHMENATAGNPIGVMIRGSLGYLVIFRDPALTGTQINAAQKPSGTAYQVLPSIDYPGIGTLTSYEPGNSTWTITRVDRKNAAVALNGRIITGPFATIGDIWEVGFVSYGSSAGSFQVTGFVLENVSILEGMPKLTELVIFGDSTAADWPGCWSRMLPRVMDNIQGIKLGSITNRAVVGETLAQQYTRMQADGFGDSYYVVICAGTNDIQGNEGVATFDTLIRNVLAYVRAAGRIPVVMLPYMWYPASARGGSGQPSANYDQGAGYRMVMSRAVAEYTPNAVLVDLPRLLPTPDPAYVGSALDPLLRDDIHPTQLCHRLYAYALAQAIVSHYCSVPANEVTTLPSYLLNAGVTIQDTLGASITQDGIVHLESILKFASATADGTVIMSVPAWLRPQGARDFSAGVLDIDSKPVGNANLVYDGISSLSVYGFPTSGVYLQMDSLTWAAGDYLPK